MVNAALVRQPDVDQSNFVVDDDLAVESAGLSVEGDIVTVIWLLPSEHRDVACVVLSILITSML